LAVINSPARYIGIMSNRRAVTAHLNKLQTLGVSDELIARVYAPIGLDIGGQKAAEIALSAVAEIQAVRYNRPGGSFTIKQSNRGLEKRDELF
jgi:xanthine dehydrogenase accessory factor